MTGVDEIDFAALDIVPDPLSDAYRGQLATPKTERDQWLANRTHAWGGSEVAPLMMAYGLAPQSATPPAWVREQATHYDRLGIPRVIAWKSWLRARPKVDNDAVAAGRDLEIKLFNDFRGTRVAGFRDAHSDCARWLQPAKMRYSTHAVPPQTMPFVDRVGAKALAVTPDGWGRATEWPAPMRLQRDALVACEMKCTRDPLESLTIPWHYACQTESEMAVLGADAALLIVGECWIQWRKDGDPADVPPTHRPRIVAIPALANIEQRALIREVTGEAWGVVEDLRAIVEEFDALTDRYHARDAELAQARRDIKAKAPDAKTQRARRKAILAERREVDGERKELTARAQDVWAASLDRMAVHRDPNVVALDEALSAIDNLEEFAA